MYSVTYVGALTTILAWIFNQAGVPFVPEDAEKTITFIVALSGVVVTLYGRFRQGDINIFGLKF